MQVKLFMYKKGQSAIEFISTYGFVFLIIGVVMSVLLVIVNVPKLTYSFNCTVYGGFYCTDTVLSYNSVTGDTSLYLNLLNNHPGIVNISTFNATIKGISSISGSCTPTLSFQSNTVNCTASIPIKSKLGNSYTGFFAISANYCSSSLNKSVTCPSSKKVVFTGQFSTQG